MKRPFVTAASNAKPVVGPDVFRRPPPPMSEFQRRARENAEYRQQVRCTQAIRAQHSGESAVPAPPQPERPAQPPAKLSASHHWLTVLRLVARIKRWFR